MKAYRRILAALAALILCFSLGASAWATADVTAEDTAAEAAPDAAMETEAAVEEAAESDGEISFEGKTWDEVMDELLAQFNAPRENVCVAYVNLVTGEEYFINPDEYMGAASMYKLPLNMYFTELIASGQMDWDASYPNLSYESVRDESIINSNNDLSMFLWGILGGYTQFRELTAEYMGTTAEELSIDHINNNMYTARQFAECLKLLYNESERFPGIIETMQKAEPERFFKLYEPRFKIAHKYGYYSENGRMNMNDCGIAFTTEPIALVMFTQNLMDPEGLLTAYATTMCEYTEYLANLPEPTPEPTPVPTPEPVDVSESVAVVEVEAEKSGFPILACAAVLLFLLLGLALVIGLGLKFRIKVFWMLLAVILSALIMLLAIIGMTFGTVYAKPSGDPQQSAAEFMDSICSGDYQNAYSLLRDYSDLGLETAPQTAAGQKAYDALHSSFSYELSGECSVEKLDALQPLSFTYLDLSALEGAVIEETPNQLKRLVETRPMSQIYDANRNYLPEITEEAYLNAVDAVLANAESYYTSVELELSLSYTDGRWQILASPALLRALNGGAGY